MKFENPNTGAYDWDAYFQYLDTVKNDMPTSTRAYALMMQRTHPNHPQALHDSWVSTVEIPCEDGVDDAGLAQVHFRLLAPQHDGFHLLRLSGVSSIECEVGRGRRVVTAGIHGDFLADEVLLVDGGRVMHEVHFASARWRIVCDDIAYAWTEGGRC